MTWGIERRAARRAKEDERQETIGLRRFPLLRTIFKDSPIAPAGISASGQVILPKPNPNAPRILEMRRKRSVANRTSNFVPELNPEHLKSALDHEDLNTMFEFRRNVLFKPQRGQLLRGQGGLTEPEKAMKKPDEELSDGQLLRRTLAEIRHVAEKKKIDGSLDLRGFNGESLEPQEFRRLMFSQLGVKLGDRRLKLVLGHFDKDGDGTVDYVEVHKQLMNPHNLRVGSKKESAEEMYQRAMDTVRARVYERKQEKRARKGKRRRAKPSINLKTGEEKSFDLRDLFNHFDAAGSGSVEREEFVALMLELGVELTKYELNILYWTLDPERKGSLSYHDFSRAFYGRRQRAQKEKQARRKPLKPYWTPAGTSCSTREIVSMDRREAYHTGTYIDSASRKQTYRGGAGSAGNFLFGRWKSESSLIAKESIENKSYLNAPALAAIDSERAYLRGRAQENLAKVNKHHERRHARYRKKYDLEQRRMLHNSYRMARGYIQREKPLWRTFQKANNFSQH